MAVTTTKTVNVELTYTDYTTRNYKIPLNTTQGSLVKTAIRNFNTAAADQTGAVAQTFLSDGGATVAEITSAVMIETTEEVLFNG